MSMRELLVKAKHNGVRGTVRRLLDTPKIRQAAPIHIQPGDRINEDVPLVYCLCGTRGIVEALWSLTSFYRFADVDWPLTIHGDGSLTAADIETLKGHFPNVCIIRRAEADRVMQPILEKYPHCRALREKHVFGLRLMDSEELSVARSRINIDTDVLFFRKPTELLEAALAHEEPNVFNREDGAQGYAVKGEAIDSYAGRPVPPEINAGLSVLRKGTFPLADLEDLLAQGAKSWDSYLQEQTLTAVCSVRHAGERGVRFLGEVYQCNSRPALAPEAAARHYYILARRLYYLQGLRKLVAEGFLQRWREPAPMREVAHA
ncbi:MAG: hypothetical protein ACF8NJ_03955 [Phycisphaerales bacterium JB038]